MKNLKWILAVAAAGLVVACCPCRKSKTTMPITGTEWKLTQMYGNTIESENYRALFGVDGSLSGVGDCNRFSGSFTMNDGVLKVGDNLASTRMMCPNQQQENTFLNMLTEADAYYIDGTKLMLIKDGEVIAMFVPADPVSEK